MIKKIFCVFCVMILMFCTVSLSAFASLEDMATDNYYFMGNPVALDGRTADGSFVQYLSGTYVEDSVDFPFVAYASNSIGKTQKYSYNAYSDLVLDYSDYSSGEIMFSIIFYDGDNAIANYDIDVLLLPGENAGPSDDIYAIGMKQGYDNFGYGYETITPNTHPYIAFSLGAILLKSSNSDAKPTHFQIYFESADCDADFRIYGVASKVKELYGDIYQEGYDSGYPKGKDDGYLWGYSQGYSKGKDAGVASVNQDAIRKEGYDDGYAAGLELNEPYNVGFAEGKKWRQNNNASVNSFTGFFKSVSGSIISAFLYMGTNIEFLGMSILSILGIFVVGVLVVVIVKLVRG